MTRPSQIFRLCISLCLLLAGGKVWAQDSVKVKSKWIPTGLRVGYEIISPIKSNTSTHFNGWEAIAETEIHRYLAVAEIGSWARNWQADNGSTYQNDGRYWRVGADVNFLTKDKDKNVFSLGFRYARSTFNETSTLITQSEIWGDFISTRSNNNVSVGWAELTTGLRVKVWKVFWLGCTARFKFSNSITQNRDLLTTDIPGYGSTNKETTWGFGYYALFRIPLKKSK